MTVQKNDHMVKNMNGSVPHGTNEIEIPELEEYRRAGKVYLGGHGSAWSEREEEIMKKYYGYCPVKEIQKYLSPGRTSNQIASKAQRMGLSARKPKGDE